MLDINFNQFPILETERLVIRRVIKSDVHEIIMLRGNPETMKFIPRPLCKSEEDAMELIAKFDGMIERNEGINWGMADKSTNKIIGLISFHRIEKENYRAEIGYMVMPEFSGKGLVSEGIKKLLDFGFNVMNFNSVSAIIVPQNSKSETVLQQNGFKKEAHFKQSEYSNNEFIDIVHYGILKSDYLLKKD